MSDAQPNYRLLRWLHLLKILVVFAIGTGLVVYYFPDWGRTPDDEEVSLSLALGRMFTILGGTVAFGLGFKWFRHFPQPPRGTQRVQVEVPDALPQLRAKATSGQIWARRWLRLSLAAAAPTLPAIGYLLLSDYSATHPKFYPDACLAIRVALGLWAFLGCFIALYMTSLPHDWATGPESYDD